MKDAFPLLGDAAYVTYVGAMQHRGANATTHLAEIRYPAQTAPVISVVKLLHPSGLGACNEAMAWAFLRAAGVPAPRHAAILTLSEAKAVKILGRKAIHASLAHQGHVLAWAAKKMDFHSIKAVFAGTKGDSRWLAALRTVEGAAIAAFDEAFLNIDRNTGNVLYIGKDSFIPIDHELSFGMQDWIAGDLLHLPTDGDSLRTLKEARANGKISIATFSQAMNHMAFHAEKHADALAACKAQIAYLLQQVYPDEANRLTPRVLSFIAARTAQHWIKERLGVM